MKRNFKILIIAVFLAMPLFLFAPPGPGVPPPPPPPPGGGDPPVGAPIGDGAFILLTLAAAYAIRKVYVSRKIAVDKETT